MFTLALCLCFVSIYCLYAISDRVELKKMGIMLFLNHRRTLALLVAGSTFLLSTFLFIDKVGLGVGIFTSLSLWMVLACLIILFIPFDKVKWQHFMVGAIVILGIELLMQLF